MDLVNEVRTIIVNSVDDDGYPNAKQMFKMKHDGLGTFWFSTNTSSMRVQQFKNNPKASLYFAGDKNGLMLVGEMDICMDRESREKLWDDEASPKYYPLGIDDPDYCVLKFTAKTGNYYMNLTKHTFDVQKIDGLRSQSTVTY